MKGGLIAPALLDMATGQILDWGSTGRAREVELKEQVTTDGHVERGRTLVRRHGWD
jgi:hypothetical protein